MAELYPEDQKKVDEFLVSSVNDVERKPFSPLTLLSVIFISLSVLTFISYIIALDHGMV